MQRRVSQLIGFDVMATDGKIGHVDEFYFDDDKWIIRYMVVKTGGWLSGRKVLISPGVLCAPDWKARLFPVNLTVEQVRNSPPTDTDKPVSRQQQEDLHQYYVWPIYWAWRPEFEASAGGASATIETSKGDPHLRSTRHVAGYKVQSGNTRVGFVHDFVVDDASWRVEWLIVDARSILLGRRILMDPKHIDRISLPEHAIVTGLSREGVASCPTFLETLREDESTDSGTADGIKKVTNMWFDR